MFLGLPAMHVVILAGSSSVHVIYPLLFFVLFCYSLQFVVLIFTHLFFVLFFYLLPLSLVPALYSTIQSGVTWLCKWYFLPQQHWAMTSPLPLFCFRLPIY